MPNSLLRIVENESYDWPELDNGIRHYVRILRLQGIETFQSCEGGPGHAYPEPTVEFYGGQDDGPRAVAAALKFGLPVVELRRTWEIRDGEMVGPQWAMTFRLQADIWLKQVAERAAAPLTAQAAHHER